jgi:hypothetical protein
MLFGKPFLKSMFWTISLPGGVTFDLSTVLLFDFGVFWVVIGTLVGSAKVLVVERRFAAGRGRGSEAR